MLLKKIVMGVWGGKNWAYFEIEKAFVELEGHNDDQTDIPKWWFPPFLLSTKIINVLESCAEEL